MYQAYYKYACKSISTMSFIIDLSTHTLSLAIFTVAIIIINVRQLFKKLYIKIFITQDLTASSIFISLARLSTSS